MSAGNERDHVEVLLENNRRWAEEMVAGEPRFFEQLSLQQNPPWFWIGCSDSRVPATSLTGLLPGEMFVHRNVANLVQDGSLAVLSALEFSVEVLKVTDIIVCGHSRCGGVNAALNGGAPPITDAWLEPLRQVCDEHQSELAGLTGWEQVDRAAQLNVRAQVGEIAATNVIRHATARGQRVRMHGFFYDIRDGLLHELLSTSNI